MSDEYYSKVPDSVDRKIRWREKYMERALMWKNRARDIGVSLSEPQVRKLEKIQAHR